VARSFGKVILYLVLRPPITFVIRHSPLVISFASLSLHFPFEGTQLSLGMCKGGGFYYTFPLLPMA